jgi:hypothetical protein
MDGVNVNSITSPTKETHCVVTRYYVVIRNVCYITHFKCFVIIFIKSLTWIFQKFIQISGKR